MSCKLKRDSNVVMTISEIYTKYRIPPNLQRHQLEVCAVGQFLCDHWITRRQGFEGQACEPIDRELITQVLLLHDMGNIIKFKRPFIGELEVDAAYWEQVQDEYRTKYHNSVHEATIAIAKELGVSSDVLHYLECTGKYGTPEKFEGDTNKILEYADMCVSPEGIVGPTRRIEDLLQRYGDRASPEDIRLHKENVVYVESHIDVDPSEVLKIQPSNDFTL